MFAKAFMIMLSVIGILAITFIPADAQQTVIGTGNYLIDVKAVQQAVDQGGTVFLKGNFFFGGNGSVTIKKDVQIIGQGEKDSMTKIIGGGEVFKRYLRRSFQILTLPTSPVPKLPSRTFIFSGL